ncbi:PorP/SprF family type IX secretion system membrane protein [Roseivirga sp. BDSF3-8]|uniref:PorP/SprF family type IX secretion system membrane protein n=1 Tax=Roseivirga sp. BDSF3-8 TaxID=3241598 RepID=UPI0035323467
MKRYTIKGWLLLIATLIPYLCINHHSQAQDAVFSQYYNASLYLNPALAGFDRNTSVQMNYRSQWNQLNFPYTTSQVSLIMPYYADKHAKPYGHIGGVGLSVYNDQAGNGNNFSTFGANLSFAYNLPLDTKQENQVSFGLQAGVINKSLDTDDLQWGSQYDPFIGFGGGNAPEVLTGYENRTFLDLGAGLFYSYSPEDEMKAIRGVNFGVGVNHLNQPNESVIAGEERQLPVLSKVHGSVIFGLGERTNLSANVLIANQNRESQINTGAYVSYKLITDGQPSIGYLTTRFGVWHRLEDSFIFLTEFETRQLKVGLSYDWNSSSLRYNERGIGTYEIHLALRFGSIAAPKTRY